jgi:hypothetical protein
VQVAQPRQAKFVPSGQGDAFEAPRSLFDMDMALTLVSIASFFAMILAWIVVPTTAAKAEPETAPRVTSPQAVH